MKNVLLSLLFLFLMGLPSKAKGEIYYCFDYGDSRPNFYKNIFEGEAFFNPLNRCEYSGYNKIVEIPVQVFNKLSLLNDDYNKVLKDNNDFRGFFGTKDWDKSKEHLQQFYSKSWKVFEDSKAEIEEYNRNLKKIQAELKRKNDLERVVVLEKEFGRSCNKNSKGSDNYLNCLLEKEKIFKETEAKKVLEKKEQEQKQLETEQSKRKAIEDKQKEESIKLARMTPDDRRAYTCSEKFGFRKGSNNFKDCIFKIYSAEIELEKLELQKQLAKANADLAKANAASNERLANAQTNAAIMQAYAAQQQAIAANTADSLALMESGLRMMSPQRSTSRAPMNCQYHAKMLSCF
jgi:hypothetical protein